MHIHPGDAAQIFNERLITMKNFDNFFDDVKVNAKAAAAVVSQKATQIYDASKHKISAEGIKRAIGKKLIELGKLTYKATTQDVDLAEDIAKVVEEITELKQNLAIINAHIADIRNRKICPECDNKVSKKSAYCNICGHKFEDIPEEEPAEEEAAEETVAEEKKADDIVIAAQDAVEEISEDAEETVAAAEEAE